MKQDGGIRYHVNILHALVSVFIEIETEIYKVISKPGGKNNVGQGFIQRRGYFHETAAWSPVLRNGVKSVLTQKLDVAKLKSGASSRLNNEI